MSQHAGRRDAGGNDVQKAGPGEMLMDQKKRFTASPMTLAGNQIIPAVAILCGIVVRTGPVAGYADVFDSADNIMAACPALDRGDSFEFLFDNTGTAFANTPTAGTGIVLVNGGVLASLMKRFLVTCLAGGRTQILQGVTVNTSAIVSLQGIGMSPSQAARAAQSIQPGMQVTGTGIPASTTVIGVNSVNGTVTLSANATADGTVALTFNPVVEIRGLYQAAA
jgi:hypothetical protein